MKSLESNSALTVRTAKRMSMMPAAVAFTRHALAPARASVIAPGLREVRLWELPKGAVGRCQLAADDQVTLAGVQGQCWVTQQGDRHDYLLRTGQTLTFSGPGRLVFEAMTEPATLAVS
jgi:hypothetical protein